MPLPQGVGVLDQTGVSGAVEAHVEAGPQTAAGLSTLQQVVRLEQNQGVAEMILARLTEIRDELRYHRAIFASREAFDLPGFMPDIDGSQDTMSDARADATQ
jgi:hypothetical protein